MKKTFMTALAVLCICTGCVQYDIDKVLLSKTEISLSRKGKDIYVMNPDKAQFGHRPDRNEYRVIDDDLGNWFIFMCDVKPTAEGDKVKAFVEWVTKTDIGKVSDAEFNVERVSGDGTIWLWSETEKMGVVIKDF